MQGEIKLRLPYPDYQFDRYRKRMMPGTVMGQVYKWMQRTDEKVFEDRANSRKNWKLLLRFVSEFHRKGYKYDVSYELSEVEAIATVRYAEGHAA